VLNVSLTNGGCEGNGELAEGYDELAEGVVGGCLGLSMIRLDRKIFTRHYIGAIYANMSISCTYDEATLRSTLADPR
jgi:hypothetical protein